MALDVFLFFKYTKIFLLIKCTWKQVKKEKGIE